MIRRPLFRPKRLARHSTFRLDGLFRYQIDRKVSSKDRGRQEVLSIDINNDRAEAKVKEADGNRRSVILQAQGTKESTILVAQGTKESTILVADGNSYKSKIEGDGVAAAYNAQKEAIGQQNVAIIKLIQEIAAGKIQIVPQILVEGGGGQTSGNLFNAWLSQMISQNIPKDEGKETKND
jgi:hypothetical protein